MYKKYQMIALKSVLDSMYSEKFIDFIIMYVGRKYRAIFYL